jgi:hypothetical protein
VLFCMHNLIGRMVDNFESSETFFIYGKSQNNAPHTSPLMLLVCAVNCPFRLQRYYFWIHLQFLH